MSNLPPPTKRIGPWTIFGAVMSLLALMALTPAVMFWIWSNGHAQRAEILLKKIEAAGEPITADDLSKSFPLDAGIEDVTQLWIDGLNALDTPANQAAMKKLPMMDFGDRDPAPAFGESWSHMADAEKFVDANSLALGKFHKACQRGGYAKFPADLTQGKSRPSPFTAKMRFAGRLLRLELEVKARNRDTPGAHRALKSLLTASRSLENEPSSHSQFDGVYLDYLAHHSLAEKLCLVPFAEDDLREFQSLLRAKSLPKFVRIALQSERATVYSKLNLPLSKRPMQADIACLLEFTGRYLEANDQSFPEKLESAKQIDADLKARCSKSFAMVTLRYTSQSGFLFRTTIEASASLTSTQQAADAGIAIELYRRENGKLPATLEALVPKYLPIVPIDPHNGKPMLMKLEAKGFTIYGVGKNKVDDGGRLDLENADEGLFFPTDSQ